MKEEKREMKERRYWNAADRLAKVADIGSDEEYNAAEVLGFHERDLKRFAHDTPDFVPLLVGSRLAVFTRVEVLSDKRGTVIAALLYSWSEKTERISLTERPIEVNMQLAETDSRKAIKLFVDAVSTGNIDC